MNAKKNISDPKKARMEMGLTSVTFRNKDYETILDYCVKSGISCIEWGSDVHVPENNLEHALAVKKATERAGIRICSYGSYYRIGENENQAEAFHPYLETASILGAPIIRLWAGAVSSVAATEEYYEQAVKETQVLCDLASERNVALAVEFHNNTLADNADSAIRFYRDVNRENFGLYYQHNPLKSFDENIDALKKMLPYIRMVHVFYREERFVRMSLGEGRGIEFWTRIIALLREHGVQTDLLFEFLKDSTPEGLQKEADIMKKLLG